MQKKNVLLNRLDILFAVLVGLWSFALYIRTLALSVLSTDYAEFQTLFYTLGMTHPTGYPVHVLIGRIFTLIPIRTIAYRANLSSAFFAAIVIAEVYLIVYLLGRHRIAALSSALLLAHLPLFWQFAIIAESYSIASAFSLTIFLLILLWREKGNWYFLFFAGLLGGASIGVHGGIAMAAPAIALYLLLTARKRDAWIGGITGALVGVVILAASFLYIDQNDPPSSIYNSVYRPSLSRWNITEEEFDTPLERLSIIFPLGSSGSFFFNVPQETVIERLDIYKKSYPILIWATFFIGLFALFFLKDRQNRSRWREAILLFGTFLPIWLFALTVNVTLYDQFFTLSDPFIYIWVGLATSLILTLLSSMKTKKNQQKIIITTFSVLILAMPFWQAREALHSAWTLGYTRDIEKRGLYPVHAPEQKARLAKRVVNKLEENAIVFTEWDTLYAYYYIAHVERGLTGIAFHQAYIDDGTTEVAKSLAAYIAQNIDKRPIYTTIPLRDLEHLYTFEQVGDNLMRLHKK
ncbi:MAG: DUF2723 domain-containing protein [Anaerolineae bacterium]|jgi:4-amino-4-deoxy-L-arabinose transferase-like glycosyltransferase|nr:DUF2723 domain-containing protein [Anaerolineae bacterium]MBT7189631.1 DUF2723 domain-containing protein [Anaerolineae bacterium]MBT7991841.1 DUF2723 domain-containing protein [Anaerolineae bacterium]